MCPLKSCLIYHNLMVIITTVHLYLNCTVTIMTLYKHRLVWLQDTYKSWKFRAKLRLHVFAVVIIMTLSLDPYGSILGATIDTAQIDLLDHEQLHNCCHNRQDVNH